jgi:ADP-ribosylglycohydrolase
LIGLAVGDALGAAVEFRSPESFEPFSDHRAGAHWGQRGIPKSWLEKLARRDMIDTALNALLSDPSKALGKSQGAKTSPEVT